MTFLRTIKHLLLKLMNLGLIKVSNQVELSYELHMLDIMMDLHVIDNNDL